MQTRKAFVVAVLALVVFVSSSSAQSLLGALAIDERQGDQWGWAVDYETSAAAQAAALRECGAGCSVVLTFGRCGAYAADQDTDSTAVGWAEAYVSPEAARQSALAACRSRAGGSGCIVRAWGCNGPVVEEGLRLDRAARRGIQQGLAAGGFDPGGADGLFGPRTRAAIRRWQSSRGARSTGYLDGASAEALRKADASGHAVADAAASAPPEVAATQQPSSAGATAAAAESAPELEALFWQSIMNGTNPADFEAYVERFPNGVFRALAQNRLSALSAASTEQPSSANKPTAGPESPGVSDSRVSGIVAPALGPAAAGDARRQTGKSFRDCAECPEMVVLPGGSLAMGRYEVTVGQYRTFASVTGDGAGRDCNAGPGDSWQTPGFPQTDRHPVTCISWHDAQAYLSWLSRTTGATYRLPTVVDWERAAVGSRRGCRYDRTGNAGTCLVGSYGSNPAGLSDMGGNLSEWTEDCPEYEGRLSCEYRVLRGGDWFSSVMDGMGFYADFRYHRFGFRVLKTLD